MDLVIYIFQLFPSTQDYSWGKIISMCLFYKDFESKVNQSAVRP